MYKKPFCRPFISSYPVTFFNTSSSIQKIYWLADYCTDIVDGIKGVCSTNEVLPNQQVTYYFTSSTSFNKLAYKPYEDTVCVIPVDIGQIYNSSDLMLKATCFPINFFGKPSSAEFLNTSGTIQKIYWLSDYCEDIVDGIRGVCSTNEVLPNQKVEFIFPSPDYDYFIAFKADVYTVCKLPIEEGKIYTSEDLLFGNCMQL